MFTVLPQTGAKQRRPAGTDGIQERFLISHVEYGIQLPGEGAATAIFADH
jgi:hypothetical protein